MFIANGKSNDFFGRQGVLPMGGMSVVHEFLFPSCPGLKKPLLQLKPAKGIN